MKPAYVEIQKDGKLWNICSTFNEAVTALMLIKQFAEETELPTVHVENDSDSVWGAWIINEHKYTLHEVYEKKRRIYEESN